MAAADVLVTIVGADGQARVVSLDAYLDAQAAESSERDANAWIKRLRHARVDGRPLRDRLTYRGDSLWWFVEIYLHKQRTVVSAYRAIRALETLLERERPARLFSDGAPLVQMLAAQAAARHGLATRASGVPGRAALSRSRLQLVVRSHFHTLSAVADRLRPGSPRPDADRSVDIAAFVHSAFWKRDRGEEGYVGPVLRALQQRVAPGRLALVGLGPRTNFRVRRWRHRLAEFNDPRARALPLIPIEAFAGSRSIRPSMAMWHDRNAVLRALTRSEDVRGAAVLDGYDIWPAISNDLLGVSHLQLPWSARSMDEAGAALDALRPRLVLTYAEAGGWGRALALEARRRRIPSVGLQHGFIYRHWLNYLHEPDEMQSSPTNPDDGGFPRPDLTLVYDGFAREHLVRAGHFPEAAVAVTGSPRLEAFAEAGRRLTSDDRQRVRASAGAKAGQKLAVLATKATQIGDWLRPLVDAIGLLGDAHLAIKCHPAEATSAYEAATGSAAHVSVLGAGTDLGELVASADLIVTVNSTAAIEAMAVNVPGLVLALPNNLSPFVECGALAGVEQPSQIATALQRLMYDGAERQLLEQRRSAFIERYGVVSERGAAQRAADAIVRLADNASAGAA